MSKKIISQVLSNKLFRQMNKYWDTDEFRWYPLVESKCSVLCVDEEQIDFSKLKQALVELSIKKVYVIHEYYVIEDYICDINELEFKQLNIEQFIFDDTFKWIIYFTHEGYITIGGLVLMNRVKVLHNEELKHVIL
ncbi:hypothetical protein [Vallitalea okinawensis]|uniref:hypothetical protein n=1 Tax=Vallitalea okinawensis TaxID=2078660 RepID=UPI000CFB4FBC|nr:hypothetical protein [Vallitalea okinawensis]